jgi:sterol desaturase/sphingolipid hydroxylase (fatty acid hydroxylase superfamily)
MPKMIFYMPTVAAVTTTAGYYLASRMGLITLHPPVVYWIFAVLVIVAAMLIQGLGILLPTNLRVYFELRRNEPDMSKIQKLMRRYVKVVAMQAVSQFIIIFIMAEFATGFSLRL